MVLANFKFVKFFLSLFDKNITLTDNRKEDRLWSQFFKSLKFEEKVTWRHSAECQFDPKSLSKKVKTANVYGEIGARPGLG